MEHKNITLILINDSEIVTDNEVYQQLYSKKISST